jgi:hypothetical protein
LYAKTLRDIGIWTNSQTVSNNHSQNIHDLGILHALNYFDFFDAVPLGGSATYAEIAAKVGLKESIVKRLLRYSMTNHIFTETAPGSGSVVHTAASAHLVRNKLLRCWVAHNCEEIAQGETRFPEALRKWGQEDTDDGDPKHCGLGLVFNGKNFFDVIGEDEDKERGLPKGYRRAQVWPGYDCAHGGSEYAGGSGD